MERIIVLGNVLGVFPRLVPLRSERINVLLQLFLLRHLPNKYPVDLAHRQRERARAVHVAQALELRHLQHHIVHLLRETVERQHHLGECLHRTRRTAGFRIFHLTRQRTHERPSFAHERLILRLDVRVLQLQTMHLLRNLPF